MATIKGRKDASLVIVFNKNHNFSYQDNPWHTRWGAEGCLLSSFLSFRSLAVG